MQACAVDQTDDRHSRDHPAPCDDVPGPVQLGEEGTGDVVRQEQRRECDHDQVVEEESPAGDEAPEVVEGNPDEGRSAPGLADRRGSLRIRERDDQEEQTGREQDRRREPEGVQRDDPEREVDRGGDLPVRDREEGGRIEDPLEPGQLARH